MPDVILLLFETARRYVVDHALTQRANLLVEHHAAGRNNFEGFARSSSVRRSPKGVDQGETTFRIVTLAEMDRTLGQHDLQRRPHVALQKVTRDRVPVPPPEHFVDMQRRLAPLPEGDVAHEESHFDEQLARPIPKLRLRRKSVPLGQCGRASLCL